MPGLYKLHHHTRIVYRNMRPYKMPKPPLTIPRIHKNTHAFIKCVNRVPNILKTGGHKKRMPDPIVSFFVSFHRPKFHHLPSIVSG